MKKFVTVVLLLVLVSAAWCQDSEANTENNESAKMTMEEYNAKLEEMTELYESTLSKMEGNIKGYFKIYDYMGKGYIKLNVDLILQIEDFEALSSSKFTVNFSGEDDMGFTVNKKWKVKKDDVYVNPEGHGVMVLNFSMEKGNYHDVEIKITGNDGESASASIEKFETLKLSDLKPKLSDQFFVSDINGVQRREFLRRNYIVVPNLEGYFGKNKQFGFYFEYYHLTTDALYKEGSYSVDYTITFAATETEVYSNSEKKDEVKENGSYIMYLPDISTLISGIYRLDYSFTDNMSGHVFERTFYFKVEEQKEEKADEVE